jgi:threonine dehydratase
MQKDSEITLNDIYQAQKATASLLRKTPLVLSRQLSTAIQKVYLKLETVQEMGAFKIRGALNRLLNLSPEHKTSGVVATSTGNHGRAIACAAERLRIKAVVFMSKLVSEDKISDIEGYGAEVHVVGENFDQTRSVAEEYVAQKNMLMVDPFDDPYIIAGQGTIGLEILQDLPKVDTVLAPVGGGGLISGIALAIKSLSPKTRMIGVSMERGAAMYASVKAGQPVEVDELSTLADNLGGGIGLENRYTFKMVQRYVDDLILVNEDQIASAIQYAFEKEKIIAEGAAVVGIAALMNSLAGDLGQAVVTIISSKNINLEVLNRIVCNNRN